MNRNVESHFALNPTRIDMSRSTFDRSASVKTSFNAGDIVPFFLEEVLPGDTFNVKTSKVVRMQTLLTPVMDNVYLDTYYFFVPNRLVWKHWKEFNGENTESAWIPETEYAVPQITSPANTGWAVGTIADYFGIPTGVANLSVNALPFRAYALIMNEWFRDQNLSDPLVVPDDDATVAGVNTGNFVSDVAKGGKPYTAAKYLFFQLLAHFSSSFISRTCKYNKGKCIYFFFIYQNIQFYQFTSLITKHFIVKRRISSGT